MPRGRWYLNERDSSHSPPLASAQARCRPRSPGSCGPRSGKRAAGSVGSSPKPCPRRCRRRSRSSELFRSARQSSRTVMVAQHRVGGGVALGDEPEVGGRVHHHSRTTPLRLSSRKTYPAQSASAPRPGPASRAPRGPWTNSCDVARAVERAVDHLHRVPQCPTEAAPFSPTCSKRSKRSSAKGAIRAGGVPVAMHSAMRLPQTGVALKPQVPQPASMK